MWCWSKRGDQHTTDHVFHYTIITLPQVWSTESDKPFICMLRQKLQKIYQNWFLGETQFWFFGIVAHLPQGWTSIDFPLTTIVRSGNLSFRSIPIDSNQSGHFPLTLFSSIRRFCLQKYHLLNFYRFFCALFFGTKKISRKRRTFTFRSASFRTTVPFVFVLDPNVKSEG